MPATMGKKSAKKEEAADAHEARQVSYRTVRAVLDAIDAYQLTQPVARRMKYSPFVDMVVREWLSAHGHRPADEPEPEEPDTKG